MTALFELGKSKPKAEKALGGKASALHELIRAGFEVPKAFVVTPDLDLEKISDTSLAEVIKKVGGFPVAVRSSGTFEDLGNASFAGQYATYLNVRDVKSLRSRIKQCLASLKAPQVRSYFKSKGLDPELAQMGVIIQKMVDAKTAGVCFSIHPLAGREDEALIECCAGLGEKLVSGHLSPRRYVIRLRDGSVISQEEGDEEGPGSKLSPEKLRLLAQNALALQAYFGRPQDIEWAIDKNGKLWILQSRAITHVQWRNDVEEYTSADFRDGGVSARVCSPLMYSLYRDAMQASMPAYLRSIRLISKTAEKEDTWIDCFYGRPFWNASAVKRALAKVPGFDEKSFDEDLGIQKDYGAAGPLQVPTTLMTVLPALPVAIELERHYFLQLAKTANYAKRFLPKESHYLKKLPSLSKASDKDFFAVFEEVLTLHQATEFDYFTTIYNNSNAQADFRKLIGKVSAATGRETQWLDLMAGLDGVSHMKIQSGLLKLYDLAAKHGLEGKKWDQALGHFLKESYFHGDTELDITTPRWGEDPERIRTIVAEMLQSQQRPRDPETTIRSQKLAYRKELGAVLKSLGLNWKSFFTLRVGFIWQLKRARTYLVRRESMREFSTRSYHLVRRYTLDAGARMKNLGLLHDPSDIFMMMTDEIRAWINKDLSAQEIQDNVNYRKLMYAGYRNFTPPNELGEGVEQRTAASYSEGNRLLRGTGCSAGIVEGLVRIVPRLDEAGTLLEGEILVTQFTDPGWTPVLGRARGVITEIGGLLSHAAVIGREYGIPAVLNVRGVTQALKTGQKVRMNGQAGTIEVLSDG